MKTKKFVLLPGGSLILLCFCMMMLAGCSMNRPTSPPSLALPEHPSPTVSAEPKAQGDLRFSQGINMHGDEQGAYLVLMNEQGENTICYADYATDQIVALCSKPNCEHTSEGCTAWVECRANKPHIATVGETLVLLYPGNPPYREKYGKAALPHIEIRSRTGEMVKQLAEFEDGVTIAREYAVSDTALYLLKENVAQKTLNITRTLLRIDLDSGRQTVITTFEPETGENYFWVGVNGDTFIFKKISADTALQENAKAMVQSQVHELFTVNMQGEAGPVFYSWRQGDGLEYGMDGQLFYIENQMLTRLSPDLPQTQDAAIHSEVFTPIDVNFSAYAEPFVLFSSSVHRSETFDAPIFYAADFQTGGVKELAAVTALGQGSQLAFWAQNTEELFAVYFDGQGKQQFASIRKSDLWDGQANWQVFAPYFE